MEVKESTLGAYQNRPVEEPKLTTEPSTAEAPVTTETPVAAATEEVVAQPAVDTIPTPEATTPEAEEVEFAMPSFEAAPAATEAAATAAPVQDWKEALKANREEALKELGLDPFVLELNEHIKNGGSAEDYLQAKAVDWTKVSDSDLIKQQLKSEFPDATQAQIDRLFNKKYNQHDLAEEEDKEDGLLMIGSEARKLRQQRIEQQAKFQIKQAAPVQQTASQAVSPEVQAAQAQQQQFVNTILNSDTTRNLFQSKTVAIQTGDGRSVNVKFANPQQLLDVLLDPKVAGKIGRTPQGEPDVQFWLETAAFMANREHYKKMLIGNPKELAKKELVDEGRNAQRPTPVVPLNTQYAHYGEAFNSGSIRQGKLGNFTR